MTAEIAILNKSAVALAADSAVTIGTRTQEEKTYDTADKLFELCRHNPIGIMIYNGLSFAEAPLQSLIKQYRSESGHFSKVEKAAYDFLQYLNEFGSRSPERVKENSIRAIVLPILIRIQERFQEDFQEKVFKRTPDDPPPDIPALLKSTMDNLVAVYERVYGGRPDAEFVGEGPLIISDSVHALLTDLVANQVQIADADQKARIVAITKLVLQKDILSDGLTGIVIAGFGQEELFPTLISFEIDGMVGDRLKYRNRDLIDIDRNGPKARVIPFAQREMVDRFLYGLDDGSERNITAFCKRTVPDIRKAMFATIEFDETEDAAAIEKEIVAAEDVFIDGLGRTAFAEIRTQSQAAIDSMIEFMPKPELAKMAEALVSLTSIKKRVSRGMDTVGGPIDVALISQAEGFVWIKRKHYFPPELNPRYFQRVQHQAGQQETSHDEKPKSGGDRARRGKEPAKKGPS